MLRRRELNEITVCEDAPTAEQNKAACGILEGEGHVRGWDYDIDVFHTAAPLMEQMAGRPLGQRYGPDRRHQSRYAAPKGSATCAQVAVLLTWFCQNITDQLEQEL